MEQHQAATAKGVKVTNTWQKEAEYGKDTNLFNLAFNF
jgi:hypothetical protein